MACFGFVASADEAGQDIRWFYSDAGFMSLRPKPFTEQYIAWFFLYGSAPKLFPDRKPYLLSPKPVFRQAGMFATAMKWWYQRPGSNGGPLDPQSSALTY